MSWLSSAIRGVNKATGGLAGTVIGAINPLAGAAFNTAAGGGNLADVAASAIGGKTGKAIKAIGAGQRAGKLQKKQEQLLDSAGNGAQLGIDQYTKNAPGILDRYNSIADGNDPYSTLANGEYEADASNGRVQKRIGASYDSPQAKAIEDSVQGQSTDAAAQHVKSGIGAAATNAQRRGFGNSPAFSNASFTRLAVDANSKADADARDYRIGMGQKRIADTTSQLKDEADTRSNLLAKGASAKLGAIGSMDDMTTGAYKTGLSAMSGLGGMYASQMGDNTKIAGDYSATNGDPYQAIKDEVVNVFGKKKKRNGQSTTIGTSNAGGKSSSGIGGDSIGSGQDMTSLDRQASGY